MKLRTGIIKNIITGNWISHEINAKTLYFIFLIVLLIIVLIYNRYRAEEIIMKRKDLQEKVEILHSKYTKLQMNFMIMGTERTVSQDSVVISLGLKLPENPPKEIVIK
jgi:cell division protein FtsL